jgi:hypothetical protein
LDSDRNGYITYVGYLINKEFIAACLPRKVYSKQSKLKEAFMIMDDDNKGYLID